MNIRHDTIAELLKLHFTSVLKGICYKKKWAPDNCPDCGSNNITTRLKKHPNFKGVIHWHWYCSGKCGRDDFNKKLLDSMAYAPPVFRDEGKGRSHQFAFYEIAQRASIYNLEF